MKSQTVHFNKLPAHIKVRAKRYAKRVKFGTLEESLEVLVNQDTVEGPEYWALVLHITKSGTVRNLNSSEALVYQVLKNWTNDTFGYRRLVQRTGINNKDLKLIMSRLRGLGYIKKQGKKYITVK